MSASDLEGWIPLDEAPAVFDRPAWAIRALIEQGKLERGEVAGRTCVRPPRPAAPTRLSGEAPGPVGAASATALAEALAYLLEDAPPGETRLTPSGPRERPAPRLEALASEVEELARTSRAREAFLVRAAQALMAVEASGRLSLPPPPAPRPFAGAALGFAGLGVGLAVAFGFAVRELDRERERSVSVQERLERLERSAVARPEPLPSPSIAPVATAVTVASGSVASIGTATTLPAGFPR